MTYEEAKNKAMELLAETIRVNGECVIMDEYSLETYFGWALSAQTKEYVETKNEDKIIIGLGSIFIDKEYDLAFFTGSRLSRDEYLEIYKKHRGDLDAFKKEASTTR